MLRLSQVLGTTPFKVLGCPRPLDEVRSSCRARNALSHLGGLAPVGLPSFPRPARLTPPTRLTDPCLRVWACRSVGVKGGRCLSIHLSGLHFLARGCGTRPRVIQALRVESCRKCFSAFKVLIGPTSSRGDWPYNLVQQPLGRAPVAARPSRPKQSARVCEAAPNGSKRCTSVHRLEMSVPG